MQGGTSSCVMRRCWPTIPSAAIRNPISAGMNSCKELSIIQTQAMWLDGQAKDIFGELYRTSGIRQEAVQKLISPEMADTSRYILKIWNNESLKYRLSKAEGYQVLDALWTDPIFEKEKEVFYELQERGGPLKGLRFEEDF